MAQAYLSGRYTLSEVGAAFSKSYATVNLELMEMEIAQIGLRGLLTALVIMLGAGLIQSSGAMAQEDGDEVAVACLRKNLPMVYVPAAEEVTKILNGYYKQGLRDNRDE